MDIPLPPAPNVQQWAWNGTAAASGWHLLAFIVLLSCAHPTQDLGLRGGPWSGLLMMVLVHQFPGVVIELLALNLALTVTPTLTLTLVLPLTKRTERTP